MLQHRLDIDGVLHIVDIAEYPIPSHWQVRIIFRSIVLYFIDSVKNITDALFCKRKLLSMSVLTSPFSMNLLSPTRTGRS